MLKELDKLNEFGVHDKDPGNLHIVSGFGIDLMILEVVDKFRFSTKELGGS